MSDEMKADDVRAVVREHYGNIARGANTGCAPGCCSSVGTAAAALGYTADQTGVVPDGADLGLGCGNPTAIASLRCVMDVGEWENSRFVMPGGQSGDPFSPHYDDMVPLWRRGEGVPIAWSPERVRATAVSTLYLLPLR